MSGWDCDGVVEEGIGIGGAAVKGWVRTIVL